MPLLEVKTAKITKKGQIAIPKEIREIEGFKEGSKIAVLAYDDHVELRALTTEKDLKERMMNALLSEKSLAKDWNRKEEDEAWKHL